MKATVVILIVLLAGLGGCIYTLCKPVWQFDHLEQNARKAIAAQELQLWAINLLTHYTNQTSVRLSQLGTNFPHQLRDLAPKLGPYVFIQVPQDTNWPAYVQLYWGSGFLGGHGIEIGPTNFAGCRCERLWQPGVYFY